MLWGYIWFWVAVLAFVGGGGGDVVVMAGESSRKGSRSTVLCLRGGGFWSELRTRDEPEEFLESDGGGGAAREGTKGSAA